LDFSDATASVWIFHAEQRTYLLQRFMKAPPIDPLNQSITISFDTAGLTYPTTRRAGSFLEYPKTILSAVNRTRHSLPWTGLGWQQIRAQCLVDTLPPSVSGIQHGPLIGCIKVGRHNTS